MEAVDVQDLARRIDNEGVGALHKVGALYAGGAVGPVEAAALERGEPVFSALGGVVEIVGGITVFADDGDDGVVLFVEDLAALAQQGSYVVEMLQGGCCAEAQAECVGEAVEADGVAAGKGIDLMVGFELVDELDGGADAGLFGGVAAGADEDGGELIAAAFYGDEGLLGGGVAEDLGSVASGFYVGQETVVGVEGGHGRVPLVWGIVYGDWWGVDRWGMDCSSRYDSGVGRRTKQSRLRASFGTSLELRALDGHLHGQH